MKNSKLIGFSDLSLIFSDFHFLNQNFKKNQDDRFFMNRQNQSKIVLMIFTKIN
jgi:hypothetical protein